MSYCRWSSDFGECDVYVYEDVAGGWTIHVAGRKLKHRVPDEIRALFDIPRDAADYGAKYVAAMDAERKWRESLPCVEYPCKYSNPDGTVTPGVYRTPADSEFIDLDTISPEAGKSFSADTPGECAYLLEVLRERGFRVPQYAIDALREEQFELDNEPQPVGLIKVPGFWRRLLAWCWS